MPTESAKAKGHRTGIRSKVTRTLNITVKLIHSDVRKLSLSALQDGKLTVESSYSRPSESASKSIGDHGTIRLHRGGAVSGNGKL